MIIWNHIFPQQHMDIRIFNAMHREKQNRDAIFMDPVRRKELMNSFKTCADFEARGMQSNGDRESGAMLASDVAFRVDKLLDDMLDEVEFEI